MPDRLAAGQQVQIRYREIALFQDLYDGFADSAGGANNGDIEGLVQGSTSDETWGAALYRAQPR